MSHLHLATCQDEHVELLLSVSTFHRLKGASGRCLVQPPTGAGLPRASWPEACAGSSWASPQMEAAQPPAICVQQPPQ